MLDMEILESEIETENEPYLVFTEHINYHEPAHVSQSLEASKTPEIAQSYPDAEVSQTEPECVESRESLE